MSSSISRSIPLEQLTKLQFLLGETSGIETLFPPDSGPVSFRAMFTGSWETCERFVRIEFYADIPGFGVESFTAQLTYSDKHQCYRMWVFAASQEEPLHLRGDFTGDSLILVGDPTPMASGMQKLRFNFTPLSDGSLRLEGDRWELDGYVKYCSVVLRSELEQIVSSSES